MQFRTEIDIPKADFEIQPAERMLFVGSCFADNLGQPVRGEPLPCYGQSLRGDV